MASNNMVRLSANTPQVLSDKAERVARMENTTLDALVQESLGRMLCHRRLQRHYAYGQERARTAGLTEADVPRVIEEMRRDHGNTGR